jgi:putative FmdB family regulatory protein
MPIYEYVCDNCARKTEVIQQIRERPLKICPHCGGKVKKAFSAPAIQFKGSGWYITDYARAKKEETKGGRKKAAGESGGDKAETVSETAEKKERKEEKEAKEAKKEEKKPKKESKET